MSRLSPHDADLHNPDGSHRAVEDFPLADRRAVQARIRRHGRAHGRQWASDELQAAVGAVVSIVERQRALQAALDASLLRAREAGATYGTLEEASGTGYAAVQSAILRAEAAREADRARRVNK